jgi:thiol-disulfide isomerase/thioredoxin
VSFLSVALLLAWIAILLMACVLATLVRQIASFVTPRHDGPAPVAGPVIGTKAPPLTNGHPYDRAHLLFFASSTCAACRALVPTLDDLAAELAPDLSVTAVYADAEDTQPLSGARSTVCCAHQPRRCDYGGGRNRI